MAQTYISLIDLQVGHAIPWPTLSSDAPPADGYDDVAPETDAMSWGGTHHPTNLEDKSDHMKTNNRDRYYIYKLPAIYSATETRRFRRRYNVKRDI